MTYTAISKAQVAQIVNGVLMGALKAEHADDLLTCLKDSDRAVQEFNEAYQDFRKGTISGYADGIMALGHAVEDLGHSVEDCSSVAHEWQTVVNWAHSFSSPITFAMHVGEDILLNGVDIYNDIEDAITSWETDQYEQFGEDVGDAIAKIVVGMDDMYVVQ